LYRLVFLFILA